MFDKEGKWHSDTGLDMPVLVFDCDGTLTDKGEGQIGVDNGSAWDVQPMVLTMHLGCRVAVMTCNNVSYVASRLQELGVQAYPDVAMEHKVPPWNGIVLVTNRKPLGDRYLDDRGREFHYGQDISPILKELGLDRNGDGHVDMRDSDGATTVEYALWASAYMELLEGRRHDREQVDVMFAAAQESAVSWIGAGR